MRFTIRHGKTSRRDVKALETLSRRTMTVVMEWQQNYF